MADFINNVAAGDLYTDACTIGPKFDAKAVVLTIANNAALMQFAIGTAGHWRWTDEREYLSIPQSFRVGNVIGVKVRNANAGKVARVLATLAGDDDPDFQAGTPFTGTLSSTGQLTGQLITGIVNADGSIAGGTGFTVANGGAGAYTVTFTTPFPSLPVVVANELAGGTCTVSGVTVSKFNLQTQGASSQPFNFLASLAS